MHISRKTWFIALISLMAVISLMAACGSTDGENTPEKSATSEPVTEDVVITIGNLTDMTGVASYGMAPLNMAFADLVRYYNEENLIPGVKLELVAYDQQFNPGRDIPGYEWLVEKGSDLVFTAVPATPVTLKPRADDDKIVVFAASGNLEELSPPGYVFNLATIPQHEALTLLKWIAENDWDYMTKGPAKIGGAAWNEGYTSSIYDAAKQYCEEHPDQFEWEGGYLTEYSFLWAPEVEALKDCDYVYPCTTLPSFVREYRNAGHTAKFIGTDPHAASFGQVSDAGLWDEIDGMLLVRSSRWWNESGTVIDLTNQLLRQYHPDEAEETIRQGVGYIAQVNFYQMLEIIKNTVDAVGRENFSSEALYDAAQLYTLKIDGVDRFGFSGAKRYATNYYGIYEADGEAQDIFRKDPEWQPVVHTP